MQRYRANVDHAFRVAGELVGRVQDGAPVGNALDLADRLMRSGDEKARVLRVRKKRRLFVEQEKVLEVNSWGPPVPLRANIAAKGVDAQKKEAEGTADKVVEVSAFLPSQNPPNTVLAASQQNLPQPTTAQAVQKYFGALHAYLQTTLDRGLAPQTVPLKHVKARIAAFSQQGLTLEVQVAQVIKGRIDASFMYGKVATAENVGAEDGGEGELERVEVAALTLGGVNESIVSVPPCLPNVVISGRRQLLTLDTRSFTAHTDIDHTERIPDLPVAVHRRPCSNSTCNLLASVSTNIASRPKNMDGLHTGHRGRHAHHSRRSTVSIMRSISMQYLLFFYAF